MNLAWLLLPMISSLSPSGSTPPPLWVRIEPTHVELAPGASVVFRPNLNYPEGRAYLRPPVIWSVQEGEAGGTVDVMGHYTAPGQAGTYHVVVERTDVKDVRAIATVLVR